MNDEISAALMDLEMSPIESFEESESPMGIELEGPGSLMARHTAPNAKCITHRSGTE